MIRQPFSGPACGANSRKARSRGFTLVEVLAALMLMAIVIPAVMQGVVIAGRAADSAQHHTEAAGLAQSQLAMILATESWQNGTESGDFSPDWPGYSWHSQVGAWAGDTVGAGLDEVDVIVTWSEHNRPVSLTLSSLAYPRNIASAAAGSTSSSSTP